MAVRLLFFRFSIFHFLLSLQHRTQPRTVFAATQPVRVAEQALAFSFSLFLLVLVTAVGITVFQFAIVTIRFLAFA